MRYGLLVAVLLAGCGERIWPGDPLVEADPGAAPFARAADAEARTRAALAVAAEHLNFPPLHGWRVLYVDRAGSYTDVDSHTLHVMTFMSTCVENTSLLHEALHAWLYDATGDADAGHRDARWVEYGDWWWGATARGRPGC